MTTSPPEDYQPSAFAKQFAKHELQWLMEHHMAKAQQAHQEARTWQNRALLAESQLATLRAEYEPASP